MPQLQSIALELNDLISFLNITIYQEYLVHRLKELSDGGAMSQFNWNGGGRFKGRHFKGRENSILNLNIVPIPIVDNRESTVEKREV